MSITRSSWCIVLAKRRNPSIPMPVSMMERYERLRSKRRAGTELLSISGLEATLRNTRERFRETRRKTLARQTRGVNK